MQADPLDTAKRSTELPYINSDSVTRAMRRICDDAGIEDLHLHDMRTAMVSFLDEAEVQLAWAAWVNAHYGWRSALPYIGVAETLFGRAQMAFTACRDAAAFAAEAAANVANPSSPATSAAAGSKRRSPSCK